MWSAHGCSQQGKKGDENEVKLNMKIYKGCFTSIINEFTNPTLLQWSFKFHILNIEYVTGSWTRGEKTKQKDRKETKKVWCQAEREKGSRTEKWHRKIPKESLRRKGREEWEQEKKGGKNLTDNFSHVCVYCIIICFSWCVQYLLQNDLFIALYIKYFIHCK